MKDMHVEGKILEAEFFLARIKENYNVLPDVTFYFGAFLCSANSILDYLLQDYSDEFNLPISFDTSNFRHKFYNLMEHSKDTKIQEFRKWIIHKRKQFEKTDKLGLFLTQKRHRIIHRHHEPPSLKVRFRYKTSDNPEAKIKECFVPFFKNQQTKLDKKKTDQIVPKNLIERKVILPIDDRKRMDMEETCSDYLDKITILVNKTLKRFPLTSEA